MYGSINMNSGEGIFSKLNLSAVINESHVDSPKNFDIAIIGKNFDIREVLITNSSIDIDELDKIYKKENEGYKHVFVVVAKNESDSFLTLEEGEDDDLKRLYINHIFYLENYNIVYPTCKYYDSEKEEWFTFQTKQENNEYVDTENVVMDYNMRKNEKLIDLFIHNNNVILCTNMGMHIHDYKTEKYRKSADHMLTVDGEPMRLYDYTQIDDCHLFIKKYDSITKGTKNISAAPMPSPNNYFNYISMEAGGKVSMGYSGNIIKDYTNDLYIYKVKNGKIFMFFYKYIYIYDADTLNLHTIIDIKEKTNNDFAYVNRESDEFPIPKRFRPKNIFVAKRTLFAYEIPGSNDIAFHFAEVTLPDDSSRWGGKSKVFSPTEVMKREKDNGIYKINTTNHNIELLHSFMNELSPGMISASPLGLQKATFTVSHDEQILKYDEITRVYPYRKYKPNEVTW